MSNLLVMESLSLDGVMQAPGRADEDTRGGFAHGGWALQYNDQVMGRAMGAGMASVGPLLFGRRTYEDFYSVWPKRKESPFSAVLDNADKYVASTTLAEPLPWQNSTLLKGDASETVARLKKQAGKDILVMGSGELVEIAHAAQPRRHLQAADSSSGSGIGSPALSRRRLARRPEVGRLGHDDDRCDDCDISGGLVSAISYQPISSAQPSAES